MLCFLVVNLMLVQEEIDALNAICKKLRASDAELIRQMQPGPYSDRLF
jgi:hypothetical protein